MLALSLSLCPPTLKVELQALRTWFQSMTLSEACRKAADSVLMPKALLEFKSYLQKQPPPCLAMERGPSNEPEVQPWPPAQPWTRARAPVGLAAVGTQTLTGTSLLHRRKKVLSVP